MLFNLGAMFYFTKISFISKSHNEILIENDLEPLDDHNNKKFVSKCFAYLLAVKFHSKVWEDVL